MGKPDAVEVGDPSLSNNAVYVVTASWLCALPHGYVYSLSVVDISPE
jgi:hypothetical protein